MKASLLTAAQTNGIPNDTSSADTSTTEAVEQVKRVTAQFVDKLGDLDKYLGEFVREYKRSFDCFGSYFLAYFGRL